MLGLWAGDEPGYLDAGPWKQDIIVERWRRGARKNPRTGGGGARSGGGGDAPGSRGVPPPSPPSHEHYLICPQCRTKRKKLFMVLAFEQEIADAELAEGWLKLIDAHPLWRRRRLTDPDLIARCAALPARYGVLFRDRRLLCADCLGGDGGIRWGEVRKERRPVPHRSAMADNTTRSVELPPPLPSEPVAHRSAMADTTRSVEPPISVPHRSVPHRSAMANTTRSVVVPPPMPFAPETLEDLAEIRRLIPQIRQGAKMIPALGPYANHLTALLELLMQAPTGEEKGRGGKDV